MSKKRETREEKFDLEKKTPAQGLKSTQEFQVPDPIGPDDRGNEGFREFRRLNEEFAAEQQRLAKSHDAEARRIAHEYYGTAGLTGSDDKLDEASMTPENIHMSDPPRKVGHEGHPEKE